VEPFPENLVACRIEPRTCGFVAGTLTTRQQRQSLLDTDVTIRKLKTFFRFIAGFVSLLLEELLWGIF
jgi:hypothetical protein